jgi:hypothetical protein
LTQPQREQEAAALAAALEQRLPASVRQGQPGHDTADERATAIRILTLRAQRLTYAQIADEMGYSDAGSARHALMRALDRHEAENVTQLRTLENLGLDADERRLAAIAGDSAVKPRDRISAVDAKTRLRARRARLNGLDAPVKVEVSASIQQELQAALEEYLSAARGAETVAGEVTGVHDERE